MTHELTPQSDGLQQLRFSTSITIYIIYFLTIPNSQLPKEIPVSDFIQGTTHRREETCLHKLQIKPIISRINSTKKIEPNLHWPGCIQACLEFCIRTILEQLIQLDKTKLLFYHTVDKGWKKIPIHKVSTSSSSFTIISQKMTHLNQ